MNFDKQPSRYNTDSVKWDSLTTDYKEEGLLPFWVADMDFLAPQEVREALAASIKHGIFGYTQTTDLLYQAIINWQNIHHHVSLKKEEIIFSTSVLASLAVAIQTFTEPNDTILIHDPVYPPFAKTVLENSRKLLRSTLIEENGHFVMDFADIEEKMRTQKVKAMILCNPNNPGGRIWGKDELITLGRLCEKYHVLLFADEIHQDLELFGHSFTSMFHTLPAFEKFTLVFTAPTKTFNLAGIKCSMAFIKNPTLRQQFEDTLSRNNQTEINTFGLIGTQVAYEHGADWLSQLISYLENNVKTAEQFFAKELPNVNVMRPEGTYLMWLDFSNYIDDDEELMHQLVHKGKVVLNPGISFGAAGHAHMRFNIACSHDTLLEGLHRIAHTFKD